MKYYWKHGWKSILCLCLILSMLFSLSSCGLHVSATELSKFFARKENKTGDITSDFNTAMASFSIELFQGILTKDEENDLVSPLSAVICLAMIANGAAGNTKAQLEQAFGMDVATLNECLYAFTSSLYTASDCKLNLADSIWFRDDQNALHINEAFLQANADWYNANLYAAPFDESTVKDINAWCKHYTDGMIEEIIDEIPPDALMYLINALVFDAKWSEEYETDDVKTGTFQNYDGSQVNVEYLYSAEDTFLSGEGVTGFSKNYAGNRYSFVALLPDAGIDIYDFIASLSGEKWMSLWEGRTGQEVRVKLPEFSYDANMNLNDTLKAMGIKDMFDGSAADFSALGDSGLGNIYCSLVQQKAFIDVNRNGTKAAEATWVAPTFGGVPMFQTVYLDRPFVYAIVDNATGLPLFIGAVTKL